MTIVLAACAGGPAADPALRVAENAAEALGGKERIRSLKSLLIEGEGNAPNLGQNRMPDGELPIWKVTEFRRAIDAANGRMRVKQVRTAQFLFAGATVQQQEFGVDGEIAYTIGPNGAARTSEAALRDRRIEMLHHPVTILRAALDAGSKISNLRQLNDNELFYVTTAAGDVYTVDLDRATKRPLRVTSTSYNDNLGDVAIETSFSDYETVDGLNLPKRLTTKIDKYTQFDLQVTKNAVDAGLGSIAAPPEAASASLPPRAAVTVTAEPVSKGIWRLAGSGNHRSILFEFDDHLVLFEAPQNELRSKAVIDTARSLKPEKPLTHAIVSHHHFDHSGGLRVAVAEGLTIITHSANVEFFKELVSRKHSLIEDALARSPKPMKIEAVDDQLTLKDASMEVRLYHVLDNPREGTLLFAYVPRDRIFVQADMYDSGWVQHPWGGNLPKNIAFRKLNVEKDVPVHGAIESYADVLKTIRSKQSDK